MKYDVILSSAFKKDLKIIKKRGKDLSKLDAVVEKLANDEELDFKYHDHPLRDTPKYKRCRECHIEPDWLLIYKKNGNNLELLLIETGSHSDLFD